MRVLSNAATAHETGQLAVKVGNTYIHTKMICGDCTEGMKLA